MDRNFEELKNISSFLIYDSLYGWDNSKSFNREGVYVHESKGIRVQELKDSISYEKKEGVIRVGVFGDSYAYGSEVEFEYCISNIMNERLPSNYEVINFGVGGHGLDQAYLKAKKKIDEFDLDIAVFCYQFENFLRNQNVLRACYSKKRSYSFF